nr:MFS transporter [uncultured Psychroserpens sp.]
MKHQIRSLLYKDLMVEPNERIAVLWSFMYFFCLLSGYFILRPIRDEMGIINGANKIQWLFTGTFLVMLLLIPLFGFLTRKFTIRKVLVISYWFFIINIIVFYICFVLIGKTQFLAICFFIWLSVFNLFVVSLFWSFMSDIYSSKTSKKVFGFIAAGGSFGALFGPMLSSFLVVNTSIENLLIIALLFLLMALFSVKKIIKIKGNTSKKNSNRFDKQLVLKQNFWKQIQEASKSRYIISIVVFILLYTAVSTILYFEQAHILEQTIKESNERVLYFSRVDLATNSIAITLQFLFTGRIIRKYKLAFTLAIVPLCIGLGFLIISVNTSLIVIAALIIMHRAGNFSLLKPSREILYTVCTKEEKYRIKNIIDTVIYRGGDALTGWIFMLFVSFGFGLSIIALLAIPVALLWSFTGYKLGVKQLLKEKELSLKNRYDDR